MTSDLRSMADAALEVALRDLGSDLEIGGAGFEPGRLDLATRVRARIVAEDVLPGRPPWWHRVRAARGRRSLVMAAVLAIAVAATAGAIGLGVPGIRILLGPPPSPTPVPAATPRPSASTEPAAPGASLGLGSLVAPADLDRLTGSEALGFDAKGPPEATIGAPDAAYLMSGRLSMVWAPGPGLPATEAPSVGLVLTQFRGSIDSGFFGKVIDAGTTVERVDVDGSAAFWIAGDLHFFFYRDPAGRVVEESRRFVGDTLVWSDGDITYRLEIAAGLERALEIAGSLR